VEDINQTSIRVYAGRSSYPLLGRLEGESPLPRLMFDLISFILLYLPQCNVA